jgi:hypothetical protein
MNRFRYDAYRTVRRRVRSWGFSPVEAEILQDAAEALLLTRSLEDEEIDEVTMTASVVIEQALAARRLGRVQANELRSRLASCGPARATFLAHGHHVRGSRVRQRA